MAERREPVRRRRPGRSRADDQHIGFRPAVDRPVEARVRGVAHPAMITLRERFGRTAHTLGAMCPKPDLAW